LDPASEAGKRDQKKEGMKGGMKVRDRRKERKVEGEWGLPTYAQRCHGLKK